MSLMRNAQREGYVLQGTKDDQQTPAITTGDVHDVHSTMHVL